MAIERLGPYRVIRRLGRGGMGTVFEAVDESGQAAAIKVLSGAAGEDEGFRERFATEIESLRKLNHPSIVRLMGFGEQDGRLFYVMELVDGSSLEDEIQRGRRYDWREVAQIGVEVCRALRHAHDRGIVHRDLKPGNLLLDGLRHVKLSDFGIARLFGYAKVTAEGSVLGTAEYMAPEQAAGRPTDASSDLYSLGGVLYALLAGRPPFQAGSFLAMLEMQRTAIPMPIRHHVPDVPEELDRIIAQLLEKEPERRYPNATVVARWLNHVLETRGGLPETVVADPQSIIYHEFSPPECFEDEPAADREAITSIGPAPPKDPADDPSRKDPPQADGAEALYELAETRVTDMRPGAAKASASATPNLPAPVDANTSARLHATAVSPEAEHRKPSSRFVPVHEEDLDRDESDDEPPRFLVSLQTWILAAALIGVGLVTWYLLQPPSADNLYAKIQTFIDRHANDDAAQGIEQFLLRFPNDSRAGALRESGKEIELDRLQRRLERRGDGILRSGNVLPIERDYLEAIQYARLDPDQELKRLQALVDLYDQPGGQTGVTAEYVTLARRRLERLRAQIDRQAVEYHAVLHDRLEEARRVAASDPGRARAMWQAIVELYARKPWAADAVRQAEAALGKLPPAGIAIPRKPAVGENGKPVEKLVPLTPNPSPTRGEGSRNNTLQKPTEKTLQKTP